MSFTKKATISLTPEQQEKARSLLKMKTHNNTTMICLTMGLLTGSVLTGLMIDPKWFALSIIFGFAFTIFYTTHGGQDVSPRTKNTFKKR